MNLQSIHDEFMQQELEKLKAVIQKYQLTAERIEALAMTPALTYGNVQSFLNECTKEQLADLFYTSGLVKLAEAIEKAQPSHATSPQSAPPGGTVKALPHNGEPRRRTRTRKKRSSP